MRRAWTLPEERQLRLAYEGGVPVEDIAARHGRTWYAVKTRIVALGIRRVRSLPRDPADKVELSPSERAIMQAQLLADRVQAQRRARGAA